jgi:hypothetical protein
VVEVQPRGSTRHWSATSLINLAEARTSPPLLAFDRAGGRGSGNPQFHLARKIHLGGSAIKGLDYALHKLQLDDGCLLDCGEFNNDEAVGWSGASAVLSGERPGNCRLFDCEFCGK